MGYVYAEVNDLSLGVTELPQQITYTSEKSLVYVYEPYSLTVVCMP